jgi:hypothetical protein
VAPTIVRTTAIGPLDDERNERARGDEVDERGEERALAVDRVMTLGEFPVDLNELEPDQLQAALLEAGQDPADEEALDAVGLDEDEGAFGHGITILSLGGALRSRIAGDGRHRPRVAHAGMAHA